MMFVHYMYYSYMKYASVYNIICKVHLLNCMSIKIDAISLKYVTFIHKKDLFTKKSTGHKLFSLSINS